MKALHSKLGSSAKMTYNLKRDKARYEKMCLCKIESAVFIAHSLVMINSMHEMVSTLIFEK